MLGRARHTKGLRLLRIRGQSGSVPEPGSRPQSTLGRYPCWRGRIAEHGKLTEQNRCRGMVSLIRPGFPLEREAHSGARRLAGKPQKRVGDPESAPCKSRQLRQCGRVTQDEILLEWASPS